MSDQSGGPSLRPSSPAGAPAGRLQAEIVGRVQGVGFRYFVQDAATALGLSGYVRNDAADRRRVEVVAEGPRAALERLLDALRRGPPGAYVERVEAAWAPAGGAFSGFAIRH